MQRRKIGLALLIATLGLLGLLSVQAQRKYNTIKSQKIPVVASGEYKLSGPYSHKNLSIFLIHGEDRVKGQLPLTLQEAMEQKKVIVHETENVNTLAIENVSQEEVFVQSGDIVKGGKQDRVLAIDLILPPKSGKMPIDSFCVEQGRWNKRGEEVVEAFSLSDKMLNSKELKIAAKSKKSQGEVWENVARSQAKMSAGIVALSDSSSTQAQLPAAGGGGVEPGVNYPAIARTASSRLFARSSSLQLTLENKHLQETVNDYLKNLSSIIEGKPDVIGYAFAINGQINSGDVYSSHGLFKKLWPKLLESSATEALSEFQKDKKFEPVDVSAVKSFLNEAESGKGEIRDVTKGITMMKWETEKKLFFETRDHNKSGDWIHRNYISK
jgi:hypothetical protein